MNWQLNTPVAFLIFNRPDTTARVFETIRAAQPPKLLVVADGPRLNTPGDADKCKAVRAIIENIDWPCTVLTNYSDVNLGCKRRVSSGLDWVFDTVEEAIILEDDCLPDPTFFRFCQELLDKYRDDERIMMISGDNFQFGRRRSEYSYYYSRYSHIWGWASWRRAWKHYDVEMKLWPTFKVGGWLNDCLGDARSAKYWTQTFDKVYRGTINTWDYQWTFACWMQHGLSVLPKVNLVSNVGFHADATHTAGHSSFSEMRTEPLSFPLQHPPFLVRDAVADDITQKTHVKPSLRVRARNKLKRCFIHRK